MDYLSKYKSGDSGMIVNISSTGALRICPHATFYTSAKIAILRASQCFGDTVYYESTKVQVIVVCPGLTNTPLAQKGLQRLHSPEFHRILDKQKNIKIQE